MQVQPVAVQTAETKIDPNRTLLSTALHEIKFLMTRKAEKPTGI